MTFALDPRLAEDTVPVYSWELCLVRLMNERAYPWLVLIPRRAAAHEIHDLNAADRAQLMVEVNRASQALAEIYRPDKINVAALGNLVPQLHVHVIGRTRSDPAWPDPVWGKQPRTPYDEGELIGQREVLRAVLGLAQEFEGA